MTRPMKLVKKIFDNILNEYSVDKNRIYVMGPSMGGRITSYNVCYTKLLRMSQRNHPNEKGHLLITTEILKYFVEK